MKLEIEFEKEESEKEKKGYEKYELEDAYRTLKRAEEIKADKELMACLSEHYEKDALAIKSLKGLKSLANKKMAEEAEDMED